MVKPDGDWPQSTKPFRSNPPEGTAGIVLPIRDNLKFFKLAFHSILDFTDYRFMLTVVDNMSDFSTRQYLESIRRNHPVNVLQYQQVHSIGAEWNLGLRFMFAFGAVKYGIVLTPDVVVEPNWLSRLVHKLDMYQDPPHLFSPFSNEALGDRTNHREPMETPSPFCTAFKRFTYERLAGFDEAFHGTGPCMSDFGDRARKAGFRLSYDNDVFVHHFSRNGWRPDPDLLAQDGAYMKAKQAQVPA